MLDLLALPPLILAAVVLCSLAAAAFLAFLIFSEWAVDVVLWGVVVAIAGIVLLPAIIVCLVLPSRK